MLMLAAVFIAVPLGLIGAVILGVRIIRWSKKNAARAAAMMTGTYLDDVAGGRVETNDDSTIRHFLDWLGGKVDLVSTGAGHHHDAPSDSGASLISADSTHSSSHCGGDGGGYCGGD